MSASVCLLMLYLSKVSFCSSLYQRSRLINLQLESLITAEHGTHKMKAAKTDVLMN